jgi:two-component system NtrC family sensor kinase
MSRDLGRILVVENDPVVADLIARQALAGQGYKVKVAADAGTAIQEAVAFGPDVVIANLQLPGLSGKDLITALSYQQVKVPIIMTASEGQEQGVIRAFRLGASDYVRAPVREAEVISAVERAMETVNARREREELAKKLEQTNLQLQTRVEQLTTLFAIGKAITSVLDQKELFNQILDGAVKITKADYGWLLIQDETSGQYILRAQKNLPESLKANMNKAWDDGLSSIVAQSGEPFIMHGASLERFMLSSLGKSILVVPITVQRQTIGLLVVMRKADKPFTPGDQAMVEAVSDYSAISLVNARLFRALDERAGN